MRRSSAWRVPCGAGCRKVRSSVAWESFQRARWRRGLNVADTRLLFRVVELHGRHLQALLRRITPDALPCVVETTITRHAFAMVVELSNMAKSFRLAVSAL
mmetsp:Transcript_47705/g.152353  ORF Transcript_47705/g.152353 Transcript_47705/m.152353 type:complete len:101 (+) Transcript_47705:525-827(+)